MYCLIRRIMNKNLTLEDWGYCDGKVKFFHHRLKGPAVKEIRFHTTSVDIREGWYFQGRGYKKEKDCLTLCGYNLRNETPSIIWENGTKEWHFESFLHRFKEPAIIYSNGDKEWWYHGARHRKDGPAVICGNKQYWFHHGEFSKYETI